MCGLLTTTITNTNFQQLSLPCLADVKPISGFDQIGIKIIVCYESTRNIFAATTSASAH